MYCIEVTTHNCVTDVDTTETLYHSSLAAAVANAYRAEAKIGLDGFVSVKWQSHDSGGFHSLDRGEWFDYLSPSAQATLGG